MGVRMALGAGGGQVVALVLWGGMGLTALGVVLGLGGALGLTWILRSWLFGIGVVDPLTMVGVVAVLGFSGLLACLVPALRAARIDPIETLKAE
jgi:ABC-type antimicrobial peptide transport system permease subunit